MIFIVIGSILGTITIIVLIIAGVIGFLVGTGNASFFLAPRDRWNKSPADVTGEKMQIGCVVALVFIVLTGWLIVKIFK